VTRKDYIINELVRLIIAISVVFLILLPISCFNTETTNENTEVINEKVSSQLLAQVNLRNDQIENPTSDRLNTMANMGMNLDNLEVQRIFIHLGQELDGFQIEELKTMGLILYLDSWIPPVGAHPTGFIIADMPIDKLDELVEKDYVVNLDTAERQLEPQTSSPP
jgi:hypothetical protein